jgi:hypothetical protein
MEADQWDLELFLLTGLLGLTLVLGGIKENTEPTSQWSAPALLYPRDHPDPTTAPRPGTAGWTPPVQLQRAVRPEGTVRTSGPPEWPPADPEP